MSDEQATLRLVTLAKGTTKQYYNKGTRGNSYKGHADLFLNIRKFLRIFKKSMHINRVHSFFFESKKEQTI